MGTMLDKADRLQKLSDFICDGWNLSADEKADAERAAYLSKSDLATGMVTEFTELQGEMGKEYALSTVKRRTLHCGHFRTVHAKICRRYPPAGIHRPCSFHG